MFVTIKKKVRHILQLGGGIVILLEFTVCQASPKFSKQSCVKGIKPEIIASSDLSMCT